MTEDRDNTEVANFVLRLADEQHRVIFDAMALETRSGTDRFDAFKGLADIAFAWDNMRPYLCGGKPPSELNRELEAVRLTAAKLKALLGKAEKTGDLRFALEPYKMPGAVDLDDLDLQLRRLEAKAGQAIEAGKARKGARRLSDERQIIWEPVVDLFLRLAIPAGASERGPVFRVIAVMHELAGLAAPSGDTVKEVIAEVQDRRGFVGKKKKDSTVVSAAGE